MSEVMTRAIIQMPYEMAMSGPMSRLVFYFRAQTLLDDSEAKDVRIAELESALEAIKDHAIECGDSYYGITARRALANQEQKP